MSEELIKKPLARIRNDDIYIYCLNVQCLMAHLDELTSFLSDHNPHVVFLQETWLDESIPDVKIPGYIAVSRRDRHSTTNRGGSYHFSEKIQLSGPHCG